MKRIIKLAAFGILTLTLQTTCFAQVNPIHGFLPTDSIPALNNPELLTFSWQTGQDFPLGSIDFQPPTVAIQKTNFDNFRILFSPISSTLIVNGAANDSWIELYGISGKVLLIKRMSNGNCSLSLADFKQGVYIVVIRNGNIVRSEKILIR